MRRLWLTIALLLVLTIVVAVAALAFLRSRLGAGVHVADRSVLFVDLEGPVVEKFPADPLLAGLEGARWQLVDLVGGIRAAAEDDRIRGILLRVGPPGYGWAKAEELRGALLDFRGSGKFVEAYLPPTDELGYFVALAADRVWLLPDGGLELNGFRVETPFVQRTFEKIGLEAQVESVGAYKTAADVLRRTNMTDEDREVTGAILRELHGRFVDAVAESRRIDRGSFARALDGGVYLARDLEALGLVDGQMYLSEVRERTLRRADGAAGEAGGGPDDDGAGREADESRRDDDAERVLRIEDYLTVLPARTAPSAGTVALVYAVGTILQGQDAIDPLFGRTMGAASTVEMLREVGRNEDVDAVVLRVDSPGGDAWASEEIWAELEELNEHVPLVVSMSDVAGSGGYYIAAGADAIVASPSTITGSIGVLGILFNAAGVYDRLGVTWDTLGTGEAADFPTTIRPLTEAERVTFRAIIEDLYRAFVARVAEGRERTVGQIDSVAGGRVWTGAQAVRNGLVDRLGGLDDAVEVAKELAGIDPEARVDLVVYPEGSTLIERLLAMAGAPGSGLARVLGPHAAGPRAGTTGSAVAPTLTGAAELARRLAAVGVALRAGGPRPLAVMPYVPEIR
ncbi:MAG TPA: signal peptide peptidase SppA [Gemmatimonadota bacterium]